MPRRSSQPVTAPAVTVNKIFNSLGEFERYLAAAKVNQIFAGKLLASQTSGYRVDDFFFTENFASANQLLLNGDPKSYRRITATADIISNPAESPKNKPFADVCGYNVIIPNYVAGVPLQMWNRRKNIMQAPVITLIYNTSIYDGIKPDDVATAANKLYNAIQAIETGGTFVSLYVYAGASMHSQSANLMVKVKSSDERLNVYKCAYPMINPSFTRRHFLRLIETEPALTDKSWCAGYGHPRMAADKSYFEALGISDPRVIGYNEIKSKSTNDIIKLLQK
jgi:hypothetical protein